MACFITFVIVINSNFLVDNAIVRFKVPFQVIAQLQTKNIN